MPFGSRFGGGSIANIQVERVWGWWEVASLVIPVGHKALHYYLEVCLDVTGPLPHHWACMFLLDRFSLGQFMPSFQLPATHFYQPAPWTPHVQQVQSYIDHAPLWVPLTHPPLLSKEPPCTALLKVENPSQPLICTSSQSTGLFPVLLLPSASHCSTPAPSNLS